MDKESWLEGLTEEEFLNFCGLGNLHQMVEQNNHEDINSSNTQLYGSVEIDGKGQQHDHTAINVVDISTNIFPNRELLMEFIREMAFSQGFVSVIKKSKRDKYVIIGCDRGGSYRSSQSSVPKKGLRKSGTRLINCPFQIWGKKNHDNNWRIEVKNLSHNHDLSSDISGHPFARRFTQEEIKQVKEMVAAGITPRQILTKLRKGNSNLKAISRTLYNTKARINKDELAGRSMIEALMQELGEGGFIYDVECDNEGRVTHLLFSHPSSIALARIYSSTFVMDCTYKTNKYKMPLLDIIGVSSFNTSFYCCFVFLSGEEEKDYLWALEKFSKVLGTNKHPSVIVSDRELALMNAIKTVFPNTCTLLCVWHIEKNILAKCKPFFEEGSEWDEFMSCWTHVINSPTQQAFEEVWDEFEVKYVKYEGVLSYIKKTWLPWKELFVSAWVNEYMHFGHQVTSRAESAHATLKRYLQVSTSDLRTVKEKITHAVDNQFNEFKAQLSSEKIRVAHDLRISFFSKLIYHVSNFALRKLLQQKELATSDSLPHICTGHFSKSMGLPCAHMMRMRRVPSEQLELDCVHPQWRIDNISLSSTGKNFDVLEDNIEVLVHDLQLKYQKLPLAQKEGVRQQISQFVNSSGPLLLEPKIRQPKNLGPSSSKKKQNTSTKRDPSEFERALKVRRCSICGDTRHDRRKCPNTQNSDVTVLPPIPNELIGSSTPFVVVLNALTRSSYNFS